MKFDFWRIGEVFAVQGMALRLALLCLCLCYITACDLQSGGLEARFTSSVRSGMAPLNVIFDASASVVPAGEQVRYLWDFGDGSSATGRRVSHSFTEVGEYTVRLRLESDSGRSSTSVGISVHEEPLPARRFTLSAAFLPELLEAGGSVNIPIDIAREGQLIGPIRFELLGAPSGLRHIFSPNDSSAERVVLTLINDGTVLEGSYPLTIYAHQGILDSGISLDLHLLTDNAELNYSLAMPQSHFELATNSQLAIPFELKASSGFAETLTFTVLNVPAGVSAEVSQEADGLFLQLQSSSSITSQQALVRIRARSAALTKEVSLGLRLLTEPQRGGRLSGQVRTSNSLITVPANPVGNLQSLSMLGTMPAVTSEARSVPQQIIVRYHDENSRRAVGLARQRHLEHFAWQRLGVAGKADVYALPEGLTVAEVRAILAEDAQVAYAEPNSVFDLLDLPTDPLVEQQWALAVAGVPLAWEVAQGQPDVVVAVIDSGVDTDHEDLQANLLAGIDLCANEVGECVAIDMDPNPGPFNINPNLTPEHGTHVSGIIAALADNGLGIAGIAPRVRVVPIKVFNSRGSGATLSAIANAIRWAAGFEVEGLPLNANPAKIINLSLGGIGTFETLDEVVAEVSEAGALVIAAAGNDGSSTGLRSPANAPEAIAVGAVGVDLRHASFSNYDATERKTVDFVAAGEGIISSLPDDGTYVENAEPYGMLTGTSMATPVVTGIVALLWSYHPQLDGPAIIDLLRQYSYFDPQTMRSDQVGAGLVRADAALGFPGPGDAVNILVQGEFYTFTDEASVHLDPYGFSEAFEFTDLLQDNYSLAADAFAVNHLSARLSGLPASALEDVSISLERRP